MWLYTLCFLIFFGVEVWMTYWKNSKGIVMIESPYSGDQDRNIRYLELAMIESTTLYDELPYASHACLTQHPRHKQYFTSDSDSKWNVLTRDGAIRLSGRMRHNTDRSIFYTDLGWSRGMRMALGYCVKHGIPYEERKLNIYELSRQVPFLTSEFIETILNGSYKEMLET